MSLADNVELSIVVPVYNGAMYLRELHSRIAAALAAVTDRFELILVDDRAADGAWPLIKALSAEDARVRGLQLSRNFGQQSAISAGLRESRGAWVVVMDCDLQDQPEEIPKLYAKARQGFDCVLARRTGRRDPFFKRLTSALFFKLFSWLTDLHHDGTVANFSIVSRRVVEELNAMQEVFKFYAGFLAWMGFEKAYVDVAHGERKGSESSYTWGKLIRLGIDIILAYSAKPLRLCIGVGLFIAFLSLSAAAWIVWRALVHGIPVAGWPTLIVSIHFSTGIILIALGVLGLYVERIFVQVRQRPPFIVRERT